MESPAPPAPIPPSAGPLRACDADPPPTIAWTLTPPDGYIAHSFPNGDKCFVHKTANIAQGNLSVGRFTYINANCTLGGRYPIRIGAFCSISSDVYCWTYESHQTRYVSTYPLRSALGVDIGYPEVVEKPAGVLIGSDVWIGREARIMPGVTLGDGSVVAARAVVTKDCEPYGIYAGVPARLVRKRCPDAVVTQLRALRWWDWPVETIMRNRDFFSVDLADFAGDLSTLVR
jgi:virginiamycin A acetyltransferase